MHTTHKTHKKKQKRPTNRTRHWSKLVLFPALKCFQHFFLVGKYLFWALNILRSIEHAPQATPVMTLFQLLSEVNAIATLAYGNIVWPPRMLSGSHTRVQVQHVCNVHIEVSVW
jgi:hypothetical protein|uniref:Uncharacterized protein n=1 Tax=Zea mays TaxID=4577 RepID=A0A804Q3K0_MAIZE